MPKEEKIDEEKPEKSEKKEAKIVEVPASFGTAIQLEDGKIVDALELQVLIYNKLLKIEKSVA